MSEVTELVWREFASEKVTVFRAQEWSNGAAPAMNGQAYTVIPNIRFGMETYGRSFVEIAGPSSYYDDPLLALYPIEEIARELEVLLS